ncbi:NADP-dependent malic enzyme [Candidatus Shapirobacteria bacterium]|nr:NADP-dependent malic enzyme [Candidatus Shapirobacteria bacterium]
MTDTFEIHKKNTGKLEIVPTVQVNTKEDLSNIYTPNVGKICMVIKDNPDAVREYTIAGKMVAVISDGSAVLGFGNIGAKAALPVMEGKCVIFKEFAGLNAFPICLDTQDTEEIIKIVKAISVNFAAINLEDISAPRCFEIEKRLSDELPIPIIHDDQHGTAIVTLAALMGAIKIKNKKLKVKSKNLKVVITGAGAAGNAITRLIKASELPVSDIKLFDSKGLVSTDRTDLDKYKMEMAQLTGQTKTMSIQEGLVGADIFVGVSAPNSLTEDMIRSMNKDPIVFAMANPTPEIMPDLAKVAGAMIVATGRSDFDNQINNALAYPGVFKGLLAAKITKATIEIKLATAKAIYEYNLPNLTANNLLPSILDKNVPEMIAATIVTSVK